MMNISNADRAKVLVEALPYIKKYTDKIIVIKYGGSSMVDESLKEDVMRDVALLNLIGVKVVLVHGGGPALTETLKRMNIESKFENGLRVTDAETAKVATMVLAGKVNKGLVGLIGSVGGLAVGLSGIDANMIHVKELDPALGYVGEITKVNTGLISPTSPLLTLPARTIVATFAVSASVTRRPFSNLLSIFIRLSVSVSAGPPP